MQNEFMQALNEYGWGIYYFAGFVTGVLISICVFILQSIGFAIGDFVKYIKDKNGHS